MKKISLITFFISLTACCYSQDYNYETEIWECIVESFAERNIDIELELKHFEDYLIQSEELLDNSGKSYYSLLKRLEYSEHVDIAYSFLDTLKKHSKELDDTSNFLVCAQTDSIIRMKYPESLTVELSHAMDSLMNTNKISPQAIVQIICNILSPADFEHIYFKFTTLTMVSTISYTFDSGNTQKLPPPKEEQQPIKIKQRNLLAVYISTDNDSVLVNNKKIAISDLSSVIQPYIVSNENDLAMPEIDKVYIEGLGICKKSKLVVSLQNERATKYQTYVSVLNQLIAAYQSVRDLLANEYFNKEYNSLLDQQKELIKKLVPQRISETVPKGK